MYSYTEQPEFSLNLAAFEGLMTQFSLPSQWLRMGEGERSRAVLLLLDQIELSDREERLRGARAVLYLAQVAAHQTFYHQLGPTGPSWS